MAPLVSVVDDDISVRKSLDSLIRSVGMDGETVRLSGRVRELRPILARRTASYWTCACRG